MTKATVKHGKFEGRTYTIEGTDQEVFGDSWKNMDGNPACIKFAMRVGAADHETTGTVYYGKIDGLGHLFHESELDIEE